MPSFTDIKSQLTAAHTVMSTSHSSSQQAGLSAAPVVRARSNPSIGRSLRLTVPARPSTVSAAVIIVAHNYGHFLRESVGSVLAQTVAPTEVVIVDDASDDDTPDVSREFGPAGVRYLRLEARNVHQARRAGFEATGSEVLCFLDGDDKLPPEYLAHGLAQFSDPQVGVVYSDVRKFGLEEGISQYPAKLDRELLERDNYLHAGSLVRREALQLSRVFEFGIDPLRTQGDWFLWRTVLRSGWGARKQASAYLYRQHATNWMHAMRREKPEYFDYAGLHHEAVTLFIPLSGRSKHWLDLSAFLKRQQWPHAQISLILLDTSQSPEFSRTVRNWISECDYADVRHVKRAVARPGLADEDRRNAKVQDEVRAAVARIYNVMARMVSTDYVWIVEDDILPPDDACRRLLQGFDAETGSVAGFYCSRYDGLPCVWNAESRHYSKPGTGLEMVQGNGFGCVILRGGVLRRTVFQGIGDYDRVFYRQLFATGLKAKVDWRMLCRHD